MSGNTLLLNQYFRELNDFEATLKKKLEKLKNEQRGEMEMYDKLVEDKKRENADLQKQIKSQKEAHEKKITKLNEEHELKKNQLMEQAQLFADEKVGNMSKQLSGYLTEEQKRIDENQKAKKANDEENESRQINNDFVKIDELWDSIQKTLDAVYKLVMEHEDDDEKIAKSLKRNAEIFAILGSIKEEIMKKVDDLMEKTKPGSHATDAAQECLQSIKTALESLQLEFDVESFKCDSFEKVTEDSEKIKDLIGSLLGIRLQAEVSVHKVLEGAPIRHNQIEQ